MPPRRAKAASATPDPAESSPEPAARSARARKPAGRGKRRVVQSSDEDDNLQQEEDVKPQITQQQDEDVDMDDQEAEAPQTPSKPTPSPHQSPHAEQQQDANDSDSSDTPSTAGPKTPPPSQPEKSTAMSVTVKQIPPKPQGPVHRLVIHKIVLVDFKSYAGRQEIGPFHKSFSAIVGPNGSGKSNTIDALLFVFGFKATKMRQGKLNELIHNSEGRESLPSCSVEVWFREIVDLPGPDAYTVVPDSSLVVSRTAFRNNTSKYTINNRASTFSEVTTLLKDRGIDLDHKRFLILQGEVESIAQMKPKAPNEHEDGLLEYLEDIIGTSNYKEPIAKALEEVDTLNEERVEKINRVKLVEREKGALESRKKEADSYLKDQNDLIHQNNKLWQYYSVTASANIEIYNEESAQATSELEMLRTDQAGILKEVEEEEAAYNEFCGEVKILERQTNEVEKELAVFERKEVEVQEKKKHLGTKQKKLKKSVQDDTHAKSEATAWYKNHGDEIVKVKAELAKLESTLEKEEIELDKIRDSLRDKTQGFNDQIEVKQKELQPWAEKVATKQANIDVAESERTLLAEKSSRVARALEEAQDNVAQVEADNKAKSKEMVAFKTQKSSVEIQIQEARSQLQQLNTKDGKIKTKVASARAKVDEAKANQSANRSKGDVLTSLTKLRDQGRLAGFHGRLGNLGKIDDKYDVAISTACGGLDNLVCDSVESGQACLEHLRSRNLGRATILCLNALAARDLSPIQTPENAPRLFDLVTPKDAKFAPAFYQVLQNTLVAKDLTQANRIAFGGPKRWRVVTLDGKLIDASGTMSGGGNRVARGGMSSKFEGDEVSPEIIARYEQEQQDAEVELHDFSAQKKELESQVRELEKQLPELEMALEKIEMDVKTGVRRIEEAKKRIAELQSQAKPEAGDEQKIKSLDKNIASMRKELDSVSSKSSAIESEIKALQNKIMEVGGIKLRTQQAKVTGMKEQIDHATDRLTKAEVGKTKAEKDTVKLEKQLKTNAAALEEVEEELDDLAKIALQQSKEADAIRAKVEEARAVKEEKFEELAEMKAALAEKQAFTNQFKARELELKQACEAKQKALAEEMKRLNHWQEKLAKLELHEIENDDDDETEEQPQAELQVYTTEDFEEVDVDLLKANVAVLQERIEKARPNLTVLKEYRKREQEFLDRAKDLEDTNSKRDTAKKEYDELRKRRLEEFMQGFSVIGMKLKEMYQLITLGGNAELELVDSLDPFSEGITFSVMPPRKSWKNIQNLSGGEKTLSSLALVFALHVFKPTPLYFMDEIDAALDFRNVSIIANYIKDRTKNAQFIIISLRNDMFELSSRLVGIYKTANCTKSIAIENKNIATYDVQVA